MPPSRKSSSSRSSSSRSSSRSRSSSSRSSSSRSSSRSHSSSSHSSYSSGPRQHKINRPKKNQPKGYTSKLDGYKKPTSHYCKKHNYTYYATDWEYNGEYYRKGYYDENGKYYENVIFKDVSGNVELECQYCGTKTKTQWTEGDLPRCSHCGGNMTIDYIDEYTQMPGYKDPSKIVFYIIGGYLFLQFFPFLMVLCCAMPISFVSNFTDSNNDSKYENDYNNDDIPSNVDMFGSIVYLDHIGNNIYVISDDDVYDKKMSWDYASEMYYERESDCYLWYNTDMEPSIWQYWYEGASSNYGDYGWMECENNKWYVEASYDNWIEYTGDTSNFWHILNDFDEIQTESNTETEVLETEETEETEEPENVTIEPND